MRMKTFCAALITLPLVTSVAISQDQNIQILDQITNKELVAEYNLSQAYAYQKKYKKAIETSVQALKISNKVGDIVISKDIAHLLYQNNKLINNHSGALEMHELYIQLNDSIQKKENKLE